MGYWDKLGLLRNDNQNCFEDGILEIRTTDGIGEIHFRYKTINDDALIDTESAIPMTYDKRTKAIFTNQHNLPFVNGARIKFKDNTTMVISSVIKVVDEQKALSDGQGVIGLNIYLGG